MVFFLETFFYLCQTNLWIYFFILERFCKGQNYVDSNVNVKTDDYCSN